MAPEAAAAAGRGAPCVGALAGWLGASARSCKACTPPASRGTSTSSRTLWRKMSDRALPRTCSCEDSSLSCFSSAVSFCLFSLASLRKAWSAWSLSRSIAEASVALAWCCLSSASSDSMAFVKPSSFPTSSSTSAWSFGASSSGRWRARSSRVFSSIEASARAFRRRRAISSERSCAASCSRRHSRSTFRTSSTPMAALSLA
mmetsp:Transcript_96546/g.256545  ORF Transcript_96546/g.256545 Transcript_96546/m.256545 type:complete len:202 (-) Transcript_96546:994-1599(-)